MRKLKKSCRRKFPYDKDSYSGRYRLRCDGLRIAAHLANVGIPVLLLDVVPTQLQPQEEAIGLTLDHLKVRNRFALNAMDKLKKTNPAPLYSEAFAERITPGNLEDDLAKLGSVDWIIEVIVENLLAKQQLISRIETVWKPGTIVSSNTSGISINAMVQSASLRLKSISLALIFLIRLAI